MSLLIVQFLLDLDQDDTWDSRGGGWRGVVKRIVTSHVHVCLGIRPHAWKL